MPTIAARCDEGKQTLDRHKSRAPDLDRVDLARSNAQTKGRPANPEHHGGLRYTDGDRFNPVRFTPGPHFGFRSRACRARMKSRSASMNEDSIAGTSSATGSLTP